MMKLEDWLDDLCVRFIINLPKSELESVERICFQVEEAQWFYEDFIRPLDPSLPSLNLRAFSLKIFKHCSLFSQWSPEYHMSAFAEFLAYKQRVPVRGAIMLNEDMDQVVLVKGWKKGANWSFPRGKINKDENDLDCAVREVYEETGFDIQEAGLVQDEKAMKYIEVTMREQHMRLYVFRGVPMHTCFEPRTRKEISKIEWYRLTDLPTLKNQKHQDSNDQLQAVNANKFYMVAPFLNPLKKWIGQQRKSEHRQSLPYLAPPISSEEISQAETKDLRPQLQQVLSNGPSNLPEVDHATQQKQDPSADLKRMLNINVTPPAQVPTSSALAAPRTDVVKSTALLALLRSGSTAEMRDVPQTPRRQMTFPTQISHSPTSSHQGPVPLSSMAAIGRIQVLPESSPPVSLLQDRSVRRPQDVPNASLQRFAPYQNTGDPQFSRSKGESSSISAVPPASALPKLTSHTKSLLDAFKMLPAKAVTVSSPQASPVSSVHNPERPSVQTQTLLDIFKAKPRKVSLLPESPLAASTTAQLYASSIPGASKLETLKRDRRQGDGDLFREQSSIPHIISQAQPPIRIGWQPAELAADTTKQTQTGSRREKTRPDAKNQDRPAAPREGETAATVNGPLSQPQFDAIMRSTRKAANGDRRSPAPINRTLFDHRNPTPVKILTRPDDTRDSPARSPKPAKAIHPSSPPRRVIMSKETRESLKPFQPQILRRPQTPSGSVQSKKENIPDTIMAAVSTQSTVGIVEQRPSQAASHRESLLSLFSKPSQTPQTLPLTHDSDSAVSTAMSASQTVSPLTDSKMYSVAPISTRSRVGSLTSSGGGKPPGLEKRQTAPGNKAFLLGYLGRIASKEGQLQPDVA